MVETKGGEIGLEVLEAVQGLGAQMEGLSVQMKELTTRMDKMEGRMGALDARMDKAEGWLQGPGANFYERI